MCHRPGLLGVSPSSRSRAAGWDGFCNSGHRPLRPRRDVITHWVRQAGRPSLPANLPLSGSGRSRFPANTGMRWCNGPRFLRPGWCAAAQSLLHRKAPRGVRPHLPNPCTVRQRARAGQGPSGTPHRPAPRPGCCRGHGGLPRLGRYREHRGPGGRLPAADSRGRACGGVLPHRRPDLGLPRLRAVPRPAEGRRPHADLDHQRVPLLPGAGPAGAWPPAPLHGPGHPGRRRRRQAPAGHLPHGRGVRQPALHPRGRRAAPRHRRGPGRRLAVHLRGAAPRAGLHPHAAGAGRTAPLGAARRGRPVARGSDSRSTASGTTTRRASSGTASPMPSCTTWTRCLRRCGTWCRRRGAPERRAVCHRGPDAAPFALSPPPRTQRSCSPPSARRPSRRGAFRSP